MNSRFAFPLASGFVLALGLLVPVSCSSASDSGGVDSDADASDAAAADGHDGKGGATGLDDRGLGGPGDDGSGFGRAAFRFGINLGHPNPNLDDAAMSDLGAAAGVRSIRVKYPEYHFAQWGQEIEVGDAKHYAANGMSDHAAFLIGATRDHSTMPADKQDWELDYYIPRNLYEPIWLASGEINPANYFAAHLHATMKTYKDYAKYWEIWNEPDWVSDWQVTETWGTEPPTQAQLPRFNGSIFDYVRMLRIAYEVKEEVAPNTYVMTGGIGYASFLSAILRYTDNPDGGKVTDAYPNTGAAYFDIVSFHHYPHLVDDGSSDSGLASFEAHRDELYAELDAADVPEKGFMVTENGACRVALPDVASGPEYARNYLQKSMVWAKAKGFLGIDWFTLSDGDKADDPFSHMGLYEDVSKLGAASDAVVDESGVAYQTVSDFLAGARLDIAGTAALGLPAAAHGYLFVKDSKKIYVLWAKTDDDETVSVSANLSTSSSLTLHQWDEGPDATGTTLTPSEGGIQLTLGGSPVFLSE